MKRLALILLLLAAASTASAQLNVGNASANCGATVNVPVTLNATNAISIEFRVSFDASRLTYQSATAGSLTSNFSFSSNLVGSQVRIAMASGSPVSGNGTVAILTFAVAPAATGNVTLNPSSVLVNDNPATSSNGTVSISCVQPPTAPVNVSPADNVKTIDPPKVQLRWSAVTGATSYRVYYGSPNASLAGTTTNTQMTVDVDPGLKYAWFVRAVNSAGTAQGETWNFTTTGTACATPAAPSLTISATKVPSAQPYTLSWNGVDNASSYTLEEATASDFANATPIVGNGTSSSRNHAPAAGGSYFYRVRARNTANGCSSESAFSNVVDVFVEAPGIPQPPSAVAVQVLPIAGAGPGSRGSFFRTSVQLHNASSIVTGGTAIFHPAGASNNAGDRTLPYSLQSGETLSFPDVIEALGLTSAIGSIDFVPAWEGAPAPMITARIYNDGGSAGTNGAALEAMDANRALKAGQKSVLVTPTDAQRERTNIGVRTFTNGATIKITLRSKNGAVRGSATQTLPATYFAQTALASWIDAPLSGDESLLIEVESGSAIVYVSATENTTQDPTIRVAQPM